MNSEHQNFEGSHFFVDVAAKFRGFIERLDTYPSAYSPADNKIMVQLDVKTHLEGIHVHHSPCPITMYLGDPVVLEIAS